MVEDKTTAKKKENPETEPNPNQIAEYVEIDHVLPKSQTLYAVCEPITPILYDEVVKDGKVTKVISLNAPPVASRIQQAIEYKSQKDGNKLSWNGLSQALGLSPGAPTNWKKGKVSKNTLEKIAEFTGVDFAWLVTGEGGMVRGLIYGPGVANYTFGSSIGKAMVTGLATGTAGALGPIGLAAGAIAATAFDVISKKMHNTRLQKALEELENEDPDLVEEIKQDVEEAVEKQLIGNIQRTSESKIRLVPLISFVQAGSFKEAIMNAQDEFIATYAGNLGGHAFALEVVGDSMYPEFKAKDKIIVDPDIDPIPGDYVIAQNGSDEATFKKYKPRGFDENGREYFELVPLNDNYPTLDSRFQDIRIIATVIDHIRNLRR
ncbi:S24 family peptidase [Acinetobacter sp. ANC 4639]